MNSSLILYSLIVLISGCSSVQPQFIDRCVLLDDYIADSQKTSLGRSLRGRSVYFVYETDSTFIFTVEYNDVNVRPYMLEKGCMTVYMNEFVYLIDSSSVPQGWHCLEELEIDRDEAKFKISQRLLRADSLEYTTYSYPSRVVLKY